MILQILLMDYLGFNFNLDSKMQLNKIKKTDFNFFKKINSQWGDMDGLRHINHTVYLKYFETSRIEYCATLGIDINRWDTDESIILASMKVDYHRQSSYPNEYDIGCRITRLGNKSFDIFNALFETSHDDPVVTATFTAVCFNYHSQKTIPVPSLVKNAYQPFEE